MLAVATRRIQELNETASAGRVLERDGRVAFSRDTRDRCVALVAHPQLRNVTCKRARRFCSFGGTVTRLRQTSGPDPKPRHMACHNPGYCTPDVRSLSHSLASGHTHTSSFPKIQPD